MGVYEVLTNFRVGLLHCFIYLNRGVNYNIIQAVLKILVGLKNWQRVGFCLCFGRT